MSNLPFLSKVIERAVLNKITSHIDRGNLLDPFQSAYRPGFSMESALLRVKNDILNALDHKKCVLLVLLDISAAFDTVDHDINYKSGLHTSYPGGHSQPRPDDQ